ncbi:MAG: nitronate monooxygenase [Alphaproteobacteria bacterium]|nr:nitronate monooxygenase [Alphaproteobacteria bacterium]
MRPALFKTRITELLGIRHPILGGGLMWLADANFVGALVNAGGFGFITPRSFGSDEAYREQLRKCRAITGGKPFGVNLYISARPEENAALARFADIALEEGVRHFETAGFLPEAILPKLKAAGAIVIHKVTQLRHALAAERAGVDAITIVGMECGGHPGLNTVPASVLAAIGAGRLRVPVLTAGGIGSGRQIVAALASGCDGVLMGSRLVVASEIPAHPAYKQHLLTRDENASRVVLQAVKNTYRVLDNATARKVAELETQGVRDYAALMPLIKGTEAKAAYDSGDFERGILSIGPAVAFADRIEPVEAIFDRLIDQAAEAMAGLRTAAA